MDAMLSFSSLLTRKCSGSFDKSYRCSPKFPIYIDQYGEFRSLNPRIPDDKRFHSFLLNKNGYPIYVGNPLNSQKLFDIFIKHLKRIPLNNQQLICYLDIRTGSVKHYSTQEYP